MAFVQQPPPGPFNFKDISWRVELWQTPQHHTNKLMVWKRVYVAHVPWVKVAYFVVSEENRGDVHYKFIRKGHRKNEFLHNPKKKSFRERMRYVFESPTLNTLHIHIHHEKTHNVIILTNKGY